jgi:UDP-N-acetylglucosamine transferase subunit ALG13
VIFATVGTHEQPMDRLLRALDTLPPGTVSEDEPIVVQRGWCTYVAQRCVTTKLLPFDEVQRHMREARIVITHGGPASIMQALSHGKVPIVVPRQAAHGEHVDDHQILFARRIADRVVVVLDIAELPGAIVRHGERVATLRADAYGPERARAFALRFDALCRDLVATKASGR